MRTIKTTVEVDNYLVSEDGGIHRYINGKSAEEIEQAKKDIKAYEESAKGVLFFRLKERGVLKEISWERNEQNGRTDIKQSEHNQMYTLLDGILDDCCERSNYYFFKPKTEEDIKDMGVYVKLRYSYCSAIDGDDHPWWRSTGKIEAGKTYIYQDNTECEYAQFISLEKLEERVSKMCKYFTKLSKD